MNARRCSWTLLFLLSSPVFAQAPDGSGRIELAVTVTDKAGKPVPGLRQDDFTLLDNKRPAKILSFEEVQGSAADHPVETLVLMDRINDDFASQGVEIEELKAFLRAGSGQLSQPASVLFLDNFGISTDGPVQDGGQLVDAIERRTLGLRTVTRSQNHNEQDRFEASVNALLSLAASEREKPGRKMLIWVGPGWPILNSAITTQLTPHEEHEIFKSVVALSTALREARITLYSLQSGDNLYQNFRKGLPSSHGALPGNLAVQVIAEQSGGRVVRGDHIATQIANCLRDAQSWYSISFEYPPPDGPVQYHSLEVKMGQKQYTAHTRTGFYAQK